MEYHYKPTAIKVKITKRRIVALLLVAIGIAFGFYLYQTLQPVKEVKVFIPEANATLPLAFEYDVRKAREIPVYPDELAVNSLIFNPKVRNIFLVFKFTESPEDNKLVTKQAVEIAFKLSRVLISKGKKVKTAHSFEELVEASQLGFVTIFPKNVTSYENLSVDEENPTIALVPPVLADETVVKVKEHVIFIKGKDREGFELATVRFLTAALGIKV